eukprot:TRINITY_DN61893_c0_g1_i1.p1 TRINITY_DN61893_c0_g1~~TRINITY_DN61893_c0_g1_i1.p1  ORF type:complete len:355 (+),score=100.04 TRINITY_DN61893_c0_g1_i1:78-1142(+)
MAADGLYTPGLGSSLTPQRRSGGSGDPGDALRAELRSPPNYSFGRAEASESAYRALDSLQRKMAHTQEERDHWKALWQRETERLEAERRQVEEVQRRELAQVQESTRQLEREVGRLRERRPALDLELRDAREQLAHMECTAAAEREEFRRSMLGIAEDTTRLQGEVEAARAELRGAEAAVRAAVAQREEAQAEAQQLRTKFDQLIDVNAGLAARMQEAEDRCHAQGRRSARRRNGEGHFGAQLGERLRRDCDALRLRYSEALRSVGEGATNAAALQHILVELEARERDLAAVVADDERTAAVIAAARRPPHVAGMGKHLRTMGICAELQRAADAAAPLRQTAPAPRAPRIYRPP